jgi:CheY-like chemotaxis protein
MEKPARNVFLIVEDDPNDQILICRSFQKAPVPSRVAVANDGDEAISYLSGAGGYADRESFPLPAAMLLDLKLPRLSGFDVLSWVRKQEPLRQLPVIILTSSYQEEDIRNAYDLGANSYLVKPVDLSDLETLILRAADYWGSLNHSPNPSPSGL